MDAKLIFPNIFQVMISANYYQSNININKKYYLGIPLKKKKRMQTTKTKNRPTLRPPTTQKTSNPPFPNSPLHLKFAPPVYRRTAAPWSAKYRQISTPATLQLRQRPAVPWTRRRYKGWRLSPTVLCPSRYRLPVLEVSGR